MNHVLDSPKDRANDVVGAEGDELDGSWCYVDHSGA